MSTNSGSTPITADPVAAAKQRIDEYVDAKLRTLKWYSKADWTTVLRPIEDVADPELDRIVSTVDNCDIKNFIDIIKDRRQKLPLSSSTGAQITSLCGQLLAFGAAGLALAIGFIDKIEQLAPSLKQVLFVLGIFYTELVLLSLFIIITYLLQATFRYPYLYFDRIGNAWPSFYYATLSRDVSRNPIELPPARLHASRRYATDMLDFALRNVTETPRQRLRNELQQYFLLVAYQGYSHQFSLRLGNSFIYGLAGSFAGACAAAVLALVHPR